MSFDVYEDVAGAWRWRMVARNGRVVADSAEGYVSEFNARRALGRLLTALRADVFGFAGTQL